MKRVTLEEVLLRGLIFSFGCLFAALAVIFVDQDVSNYFGQESMTRISLMAREITNIGLGEHWFALALIVYAVARFMPTKAPALMDNLRRWAIYLFVGLLFSGILLQISKWIIGRQRPHLSPQHDPLVFQPLTSNWHYHSLPSGHSQVLFSVATAFALLWPRGGFFVYVVAGALAFTRVMTEQHFVSDVIAGSLLGAFGTMWAYGLLAKRILPPRPLFSVQENR